MARYVIQEGRRVNRETGEPMLTEAQRALPVPVPQVVRDIDPYRSPVDGRVIGSRSERRDDLKRNGCVEYEPSLSPTKGKFKNEAFCAKHGLRVSEEFQ